MYLGPQIIAGMGFEKWSEALSSGEEWGDAWGLWEVSLIKSKNVDLGDGEINVAAGNRAGSQVYGTETYGNEGSMQGSKRLK